jgi:hypothetical protein
MKSKLSRVALLAILAIALATVQCNKVKDVAPKGETLTIAGNTLEKAEGTISNVVKQNNTTEIKLADVQKLETATKTQLTFAGSATSVKSLKPGQVVLFEGHSLKKITSINESGGKIIANVTNAKFNEYYKDVKIDYQKQMYWTTETVKNARYKVGGARQAFTQKTLDNGIEFTGEIQGWKLSVKLTPETSGSGRKLNIETTAKNGRAAAIEAKGFISDFSAESDIAMAESNLNSYNHQHNNLNGELEVKYAFLQLSEVAQIEIPLEISRTILVNGIIPVTFSLKCVLKVFPEVAANSSSQAHLKMTYNGSQGFNYQGRNLTTAGTIAGFDVTNVGDTGSASEGIVGVGVGLEFPRFSVGVFGNLVVPYMLNNTSVVSYFESGLPFVPGPCNEARMTLKGVVGVDLSFFGITFSASRDMYEKRKVFRTAGSRCPESSIPRVSDVLKLN